MRNTGASRSHTPGRRAVSRTPSSQGPGIYPGELVDVVIDSDNRVVLAHVHYSRAMCLQLADVVGGVGDQDHGVASVHEASCSAVDFELA